MIFSSLLVIAACAIAIAADSRWRAFSLLVLMEIGASVLVGAAPVSGVWFPLVHSVQAVVFMVFFLQLNNAYASDYVHSLGYVVAVDMVCFGEYFLGLNIFYPVRPYLLAPVAIYQLWLSWRGGRNGGKRVGNGVRFPSYIRRGRHG